MDNKTKRSTVHFISGHLDLTKEEFAEHYASDILCAVQQGDAFVVGDAPGCDFMAQRLLANESAERVKAGLPAIDVTVYHMLEKPRHSFGSGFGSRDPNVEPSGKGFPLVGGFSTDDERDAAMTASSQRDIAWVRRGGGARNNLKRRSHQERAVRSAWSRYDIEPGYAEYPIIRVLPAKATTLSRYTVPLPPELWQRYQDALKKLSETRAVVDAIESEIKTLQVQEEDDPTC